jgi:hypothetical protein
LFGSIGGNCKESIKQVINEIIDFNLMKNGSDVAMSKSNLQK